MDMFFTDSKLQQRIQELEKYRYRDIMPLSEFQMTDADPKVINPTVPTPDENWEQVKTGDHWCGRDRYLWLIRTVQVPEEWRGRRVVGVFNFGNMGIEKNSSFEAMCYLDGKIYQGVDENHKEVFLPEARCGTKFNLAFRFWSGLEGGGIPTLQEHKLQRADLAWLDETVDDLYYLGKVMLDTVKLLAEEDPVAYELRTALDQALLLVDWSEPGSEAFYASVEEAGRKLNELVDAMDKHSLVTISGVGHTHIDMAWLWQLKHTKEKASRSFATVLRMMELFPEYYFLQTQPQLYAYVKEEFPELYDEIKKRVQEGRWEPDGGMWVEADCNLTSGESLTRQFLLGRKFMLEEFGKEPTFLWLPDVFGYSWALPQILKKSGIELFMTTKISWSQYNRMPHDTFRWKGLDGSEILTHFITTLEPNPDCWFYTYNGQLTPETVLGSWKAYREKAVNKDILISYGFGDGGGGVNRDMLELRRRLDQIPGVPNVKTTKAGDYFDKLKNTFANTDQYVHTWDGELYLEYHRGTYTSHAHNKRMNRKMELLYRKAEWLTAMAALAKGDLSEAQQEALTDGWHLILVNQFHDIIPGSSIREVYEDSKEDYEKIRQIGEAVADKAVKQALVDEKAVTVYNASGWSMDELIEVPVQEGIVYREADGAVCLSQKANDKQYVLVKNVPAMGCKTLYAAEAQESRTQEDLFTVKDREIETPFYNLSFNEAGQLTRIYDRKESREVLAVGERGNVLQMFEDKPMNYDAWDIDLFYQQKMREITDLTAFEVTECGPLRLTLHLEWKYGKSVISQNVILYSGDRRIDFQTEVDFHERQQLLKAAFPVDVRSTYATYDIQYGNVRRPNHWNTSWDQARFESVGHRFADLSEHDYGVALLNDCKYGYDIKDNVLRISLIKSAVSPDYEQDQGMHYFTYSLFPHTGDFVEGGVVEVAHALNNPMDVYDGSSAMSGKSFFTLDNRNVEVDAVKKSEDGKYLVIRLHEFAGARQQVELKPSFAYMAWTEGDLMERPVGEFKSGAVQLTVRPYEIQTLLFKIKED